MKNQNQDNSCINRVQVSVKIGTSVDMDPKNGRYFLEWIFLNSLIFLFTFFLTSLVCFNFISSSSSPVNTEVCFCGKEGKEVNKNNTACGPRCNFMDVCLDAMMISVAPMVWIKPKLTMRRFIHTPSRLLQLLGLYFCPLWLGILHPAGPVTGPRRTWPLTLCTASKHCAWHCTESFPAINRNVAGTHGLLEGVFVSFD